MKVLDFRSNNTLYRVTKDMAQQMENDATAFAEHYGLHHNFLDIDCIFHRNPNAVFGFWVSAIECSVCWTDEQGKYKVIDLTKGQRSE